LENEKRDDSGTAEVFADWTSTQPRQSAIAKPQESFSDD